MGAGRPGDGKGEGEAETAIQLIALLDRDGVTVTADALHCHRRMAGAVRARGGHYMLALKGNRAALLADADAQLDHADQTGESARAASDEIAHGRRERRTIRIAPAGDMADRHRFPDLAALAEITARRDDGPENARLFLLSRALDPDQALARSALSILQRIDNPNASIQRRPKRCAWEDDYLLKAIAHMR